jgi:hypothetical protein
MELVLEELDAGTNLGNGCGRRMETATMEGTSLDGGRTVPASGASRVRPASRGGVGEWSLSRDGGQRR